MLKRKKQKNLREKKLEKAEKKVSGDKNSDLQKNDLAEQIKKATEGLFYISETDAEILPFRGNPAEAVTKEEVLSQIKGAANLTVEERDFTGFFARLTEMQEWFGDEEKETAQKFKRLKDLLEKNLKNLKVFKVGKIQLDIYVVGLDAENNLSGIKMKAVET